MAISHVIYSQRPSSSVLLLLVLYHLFIVISGGHSLVVTATVGHHAVLPCEVDPTTYPNIDLTDLTVEWTRPDLPGYVYNQRNGGELQDDKNPSYMERTSLFQDEVKKGNVSLNLTRVKLSDEGNYTCKVPEFNKESSVHLTVDSSSVGPSPWLGPMTTTIITITINMCLAL